MRFWASGQHGVASAQASVSRRTSLTSHTLANARFVLEPALMTRTMIDLQRGRGLSRGGLSGAAIGRPCGAACDASLMWFEQWCSGRTVEVRGVAGSRDKSVMTLKLVYEVLAWD